MSRLFGRGQLKIALLQVAADLDAANGYTIMQALDERVGGSWQPSPGAIYPALLALEDAGLLAGVDAGGQRAYRVTARGRQALAVHPDAVAAAAGKARSAASASVTTAGEVLDRVVAGAPHRRRRLDARAAQQLEHRLDVALRTALDDGLAEVISTDPHDRGLDGPTTKETLDG